MQRYDEYTEMLLDLVLLLLLIFVISVMLTYLKLISTKLRQRSIPVGCE